jgi:peptidoglycan hydrolase CwlO-like protein
MTDLNSILLSVLIFSGIAFIGVAVYVLFRIAKTIDATKLEIMELNHAVVPLLEKVDSMVQQAGEALSMLNENREDIGKAVANIRQVTQHISHIERLVFDKIEPSIFGLASLLSGLNKGARTFVENWRRSHS